jgi:predicted RNA methylase
MAKEKRAKMQMDEEAWYSVTDQRTAERTSKLLLKLDGITAESTITDGTACVGGNVMSFANYFAKVQAVELDSSRFQMLRNNLKIVGATNVECYNDDFTTNFHRLKQDIIFMDPPWGGPEYRNQVRRCLHIRSTHAHATPFHRSMLICSCQPYLSPQSSTAYARAHHTSCSR